MYFYGHKMLVLQGLDGRVDDSGAGNSRYKRGGSCSTDSDSYPASARGDYSPYNSYDGVRV